MIEILGVIMARGGSKGVLRKNIKELYGHPLIYYTIKSCQHSKRLTRFVVSTEDAEIKEIAKNLGAYVVDRPTELAGDYIRGFPVLKHALRYLEEKENYKADILVNLSNTTPLRQSNDIDNAIKMIVGTNCDAVFSVTEINKRIDKIHTLDKDNRVKFFWPATEEELKVERRQDLPKYYILNASITAVQVKNLMAGDLWKEIFLDNGKDLRAIIMPPERSIDINTELDFDIASVLMKRLSQSGQLLSY